MRLAMLLLVTALINGGGVPLARAFAPCSRGGGAALRHAIPHHSQQQLQPNNQALARRRINVALRRASTSTTTTMSSSTSNSNEKKRVVFLGTPDVAARSLDLLLAASQTNQKDSNFEIISIVTQPPAPAGRKLKLTPSPVQVLAEAANLPIYTPDKAKDPAFLEALQASQPDLCITAAYGNFLPTAFLKIPKYGTLNIHPSLLPKYRGASPVQRTLENGDAETGVTVLFTVLKMDAGPVLRQVRYPLSGDEKAPELLKTLFEKGTEALVEALPSVWEGTATTTPQEESEVTQADKLTAAEAAVCFAADSARTIHNKVRGFAIWPGTWSLFDLEGEAEPVRLKIITTKVVEEGGGKDGSDNEEVKLVGKALRVTCGDGSVLDLLEVQPVGKKVMDAKSYANGLRGRTLKWRGTKVGEAA